jgi:imidazolonepropionase-like amidohydrolase
MTTRAPATTALCGLWLAAACGTPPAETTPPGTAIVYEGARLIVGDGSAPIEASVFVVDDGIITSAGQAGEVTAPPGAARVDLTGTTVMPDN